MSQYNALDVLIDHANHVRHVDKVNTIIQLDRPGVRNYGGVINMFHDYTTEEIIAFLNEKHFIVPRQLPDGSWCAIYELMNTWSVCTNITKDSPFAYRWCFEIEEDAKAFLAELECFDDVPRNTSSLRVIATIP